MQNKVCICPKLWMYGSEFFSLWALYLEVGEIAEVRLNCLVIPDNILAKKITRQHLLTINSDVHWKLSMTLLELEGLELEELEDSNIPIIFNIY